MSSEERANPAVDQSILRGMKMMMMSDTDNSIDGLRIGDANNTPY
jgi:hypothetical protein